MPKIQIQRFDNEKATDELFEPTVWINDAIHALGQLTEQCKTMCNDPDFEKWCVSVRDDTDTVIKALEKLRDSINDLDSGM